SNTSAYIDDDAQINQHEGLGDPDADPNEVAAPKSADQRQSVRLPPYPHPFKNCIVLGLMLGEDGQKMSKSKRNYREPDEIFDRYGADALRWYLFANQPPWTSIRYSEQAIKDSVPEFLLRLWNVYSFFTIYANIDGFDPAQEIGRWDFAAAGDVAAAATLEAEDMAHAESYRPVSERGQLDRWILSELHRTAAEVVERMDRYDNFAACQSIVAYVDALSNWYVRRSRDRFWAADKRATEKLDAYWTLYECLVTTAKLIAPFTPFLAESLWRNLAVAPFADCDEASIADSVHLADYPTGDHAAIDDDLSERMELVRLISSLGRNARTGAQLKVRQPLSKIILVLVDTTHQDWLENHAAVIADEVNVKRLEFSSEPHRYVEHEVLPNFKVLGPRLGKLMPKVKQALGAQDATELLANVRDNGQIDLVVDGQEIALLDHEVEVRIKARDGWASANDRGVVVVLATELSEELVREGLARDLVRVIQDRRKELGCEFTDRIEVGVETDDATIQAVVSEFGDYIAAETLADSVSLGALEGVESIEVKLGEASIKLYVRQKS
ncbi:MAG: DUF5915 domain-containing protein, partial [Planctomycetota bacterium]